MWVVGKPFCCRLPISGEASFFSKACCLILISGWSDPSSFSSSFFTKVFLSYRFGRIDIIEFEGGWNPLSWIPKFIMVNHIRCPYYTTDGVCLVWQMSCPLGIRLEDADRLIWCFHVQILGQQYAELLHWPGNVSIAIEAIVRGRGRRIANLPET